MTTPYVRVMCPDQNLGTRRPEPRGIVQGQELCEQEQMAGHDLSSVPVRCQPHGYLYRAAAVGWWSGAPLGVFPLHSCLLPAEPQEDYARGLVNEASCNFRQTDPWKGSFLQPANLCPLPLTEVLG